ncbi:MAG: precorrin-3B C(17)-methyltransferase [Actinomycetota bacterium]|nr:precorrin-3B C(17)-methyltransferase [Actinomycetota bacterium]
MTEAGRALCARLPYEAVHGGVGEVVRQRWRDVDAFVLFLATGAAVRIVAPLLEDKHRDPAVVCVDDAGRFAVSLCGGHGGGANSLATEVGALLGCSPVTTTATDATGIASLDLLPGFTAAGDVAAVTVDMLDGRRPRLENELRWPLPPSLSERVNPAGSSSAVPSPVRTTRIVVTDRTVDPSPGQAVLHPPSLVAGIGTSTDASPDDVAALVAGVLADAGLAWHSLAEVATIDRRRDHPAVTRLGLAVRAFTAEELAAVDVPTPSAVVASAVGTASVCEAAALLAAGLDAELVVHKRSNAVATLAVARRAAPPGRVLLVGLGPGHPRHRTPAAAAAVGSADVVIGYGPYVDQAVDLLRPHQQVVRSPIGAEVDRGEQALSLAGGGRCVAVVCSGDAGVYAMASIVTELAARLAPGVGVEVVPGVTAALAAAAALGAPLGHDHAVVSLSDLLTPWDVIERRLRAAAEADLVLALYNPRSKARTWQLGAARQVLLEQRKPDTPVGVVTDAGRPGQRVRLTTLDDLGSADVDMRSCVIVGSTTTTVVGGRMVTPRGYQP